MTAERIEFSLVDGSEEEFPRPYPAHGDIPVWFKQMPAEVDVRDHKVATVKNCPPFIEALTCGYIIPLVADISLTITNDGLFFGQGPTSNPKSRFNNIVQIHHSSQAKGSPFEFCPIVKILNPWLMRTPPGFSTMFLPLLNRFQVHLAPLAGVVETDIFYREINFPSVLTIQRGATLTLPKGTPFVQAIPIKRYEYESEVVPLDEATYKTSRPEDPAEKPVFYRNRFWRKKTYR